MLEAALGAIAGAARYQDYISTAALCVFCCCIIGTQLYV